jgi:hypothetical protein
MTLAIRPTLVLGSSLLFLTLASPALSQGGGPPPTPAKGPPFGLPGSAPPDFSRGKGGGKANADVSFNCLGVFRDGYDEGSPFAYVTDDVVLESSDSIVVLEGAASGDLAGGDVTRPVQGAAASIATGALTLQPFDICSSSAGSMLDSIVSGTHLLDSQASGIADVDFVFEYRATLELQEAEGSAGHFIAFTGTELEVLGIGADYFQVSATGDVVEVPPGLSIEDRSEGSVLRFEISGTYVVEGQLLYGPGVKNVVKTTMFAGGEIDGLDLRESKIVAGFAAADAIDSISYEIVSLDPDVSFTFVAAPDTASEEFASSE